MCPGASRRREERARKRDGIGIRDVVSDDGCAECGGRGWGEHVRIGTTDDEALANEFRPALARSDDAVVAERGSGRA